MFGRTTPGAGTARSAAFLFLFESATTSLLLGIINSTGGVTTVPCGIDGGEGKTHTSRATSILSSSVATKGSSSPKLSTRCRARFSAFRRALRLRSPPPGCGSNSCAGAVCVKFAVYPCSVSIGVMRSRFSAMSIARVLASPPSPPSSPPFSPLRFENRLVSAGAVCGVLWSRPVWRYRPTNGDNGHGPPCVSSDNPAPLATATRVQTCTSSPSRSTASNRFGTAYPPSLSVTSSWSHTNPRSATIDCTRDALVFKEACLGGGWYHTHTCSGARRFSGSRLTSTFRRSRGGWRNAPPAKPWSRCAISQTRSATHASTRVNPRAHALTGRTPTAAMVRLAHPSTADKNFFSTQKPAFFWADPTSH